MKMEHGKTGKGFTLIEIMIVIVIIGILAAIAASYMKNSRQSAYDASAKQDLKAFILAQEAYFSDNDKFAGSVGQSTRNDGTPSDFSVGDLNLSTGVVITIQSGDPNDPYKPGDPFTVESRHGDSARKYTFNTIANLITEN